MILMILNGNAIALEAGMMTITLIGQNGQPIPSKVYNVERIECNDRAFILVNAFGGEPKLVSKQRKLLVELED